MGETLWDVAWYAHITDMAAIPSPDIDYEAIAEAMAGGGWYGPYDHVPKKELTEEEKRLQELGDKLGRANKRINTWCGLRHHLAL